MIQPTMRMERQLFQDGFTVIAGVDEVGRGAWAGPIVAAAVVLPFSHGIENIRDSKLLTKSQRELLYDEITGCATAWATSCVSAGMIDEHGLTWANLRILELALASLNPCADFALLDGTFSIQSRFPTRSVIDGDAECVSIAAASIVAKVTRDRLMEDLDRAYPVFGFSRNCGYGTAAHRSALEQEGATRHHRFSFAPIRPYRNRRLLP